MCMCLLGRELDMRSCCVFCRGFPVIKCGLTNVHAIKLVYPDADRRYFFFRVL